MKKTQLQFLITSYEAKIKLLQMERNRSIERDNNLQHLKENHRDISHLQREQLDHFRREKDDFYKSKSLAVQRHMMINNKLRKKKNKVE